MALSDLLYIDTHEALDAWAAHLARASIIGVDTESDSFHRYREKVCLIQMTALGQDAIIDPLALGSLAPLAPIFADPSRIKIFHDAGYDLVCLRRDFGFAVQGIFDTMLASRLLGARQFGLAAVLKARFAFEADKRFQRSDWSQRPLSAEQLAYARFDTHYLPALHTQLTGELAACGRLAWAIEDFARLPETAARLSGRTPGVDPKHFWRIQGAKGLTPEARGRYEGLRELRRTLAEGLDVEPEVALGNALLEDLAKTPPETLTAMGERPELRGWRQPLFAQALFHALHAPPKPGQSATANAPTVSEA